MDQHNEDARKPQEQEPIVIRDKRRVNSDGTPRTPDAEASPGDQPEVEQPGAVQPGVEPNADRPGSTATADVPTEQQLTEIDRLTKELAERTNDLQRVNAEYANYRRRTDRERESFVEMGQSALVAKLLPVLDDIDRADQHGDLTGGFKNVADALRKVLTEAGLEEFGSEGDEFDPQIHQAVSQQPSPDVEAEVLGAVMRKGYRHGERVLREAMVAVKVPE